MEKEEARATIHRRLDEKEYEGMWESKKKYENEIDKLGQEMLNPPKTGDMNSADSQYTDIMEDMMQNIQKDRSLRYDQRVFKDALLGQIMMYLKEKKEKGIDEEKVRKKIDIMIKQIIKILRRKTTWTIKDKEETRLEVHRRLDKEFEKMWKYYEKQIKKIHKHGKALLTTQEAFDMKSADNLFAGFSYTEIEEIRSHLRAISETYKDAEKDHSPLFYDMNVLQDSLQDLCNQYLLAHSKWIVSSKFNSDCLKM
jgi:hypothetical protein